MRWQLQAGHIGLLVDRLDVDQCRAKVGREHDGCSRNHNGSSCNIVDSGIIGRTHDVASDDGHVRDGAG